MNNLIRSISMAFRQSMMISLLSVIAAGFWANHACAQAPAISSVTVNGAYNNYICRGASATITVNFSGGTAPFSYAWYLNTPGTTVISTSSSFSITNATSANTGTYYLIITDANGLSSAPAASPLLTVVSINSTITPSLGGTATTSPVAICNSASTALSVGATAGYGIYSWLSSTAASGPYAALPSSTSSTLTPDKTLSGTTYYRVAITETASGCVDTTLLSGAASLTIYPLPVASFTVPSVRFCNGDSIQLTATAASGVSYAWSLNGGGFGAASSRSITTYLPGAYTLTTTDVFTSCTATSNSVTIYADPKPQATISSATGNLLCSGSTATLTGAASNSSFSSNNMRYNWLLNNVPVTPSSFTSSNYSTTSVGDYRLHLIDLSLSSSCSDTSQVFTITPGTTITPSVSISTQQGVANTFSICPATSTVFYVLASNYGNNSPSFAWSINNSVQSTGYSNSFSTSLNYGDSLTVSIIPPTGVACFTPVSSKAVYPISCSDVAYIPKGFTPSASTNNVLKPIIPAGAQLIRFRIFSRFNNIVYDSKDAAAGWDGTSNGYKLEQDTYICELKYIYNNQTVSLQGATTLIR